MAKEYRVQDEAKMTVNLLTSVLILLCFNVIFNPHFQTHAHASPWPPIFFSFLRFWHFINSEGKTQ